MLQFENVSVNKNKVQILKDVTFSLKPHTITVLLGKNGSGKSTLLSCLTSQCNYRGNIFFGDKDLLLMEPKQRAQLVSVLPQILPSVPLTVEELVKLGRNPYIDLGRNFNEKDKEQVNRAIEETKTQGIRHKKLTEISGGERQRAYIAMVLAQNTRVVALDEPTTYLDAENEKEFTNLLKELKERHKKTLIVVMHNLDRAFEIADNVVVLENGEMACFLKKEEALNGKIVEELFNVKKYEVSIDGKSSYIFR